MVGGVGSRVVGDVGGRAVSLVLISIVASVAIIAMVAVTLNAAPSVVGSSSSLRSLCDVPGVVGDGVRWSLPVAMLSAFAIAALATITASRIARFCRSRAVMALVIRRCATGGSTITAVSCCVLVSMILGVDAVSVVVGSRGVLVVL